MKNYINMMEAFVEEILDDVAPELDCCTCEQCRSDIAAWTLNHLPPRYVASHAGNVISKADSLRIQHLTDVRTALIQAAEMVRSHPRHVPGDPVK